MLSREGEADPQGTREIQGSNTQSELLIANCCCHLVFRNVTKFHLFLKYYTLNKFAISDDYMLSHQPKAKLCSGKGN